MNKFFYAKIISLKKNLLSILTILFIIALILYSKSNIQSAREGLNLWLNNVVPSLFPFFIATEILVNTNVITVLGKLLEKPVSKIFNVPGEGAFALIMGMICGYPTGAKIVTELKAKQVLTLEEAERLLAYTNNSGPLFILGTVGVTMLGSEQIGKILLISHLISCLIVGLIFKTWKNSFFGDTSKKMNFSKAIEETPQKNHPKNFGEILSSSIKNSITTIVTIGRICSLVLSHSINSKVIGP